MTSIVFINSFGVKNHTHWAFESNLSSAESNDSKIVYVRPSKCNQCHFEPRYIPLGLKPLLFINAFTGQPSIQCYHEPNYTAFGLKLLLSIRSRIIRNQLLSYSYQSLSILNSVISCWTILLSFETSLIQLL